MENDLNSGNSTNTQDKDASKLDETDVMEKSDIEATEHKSDPPRVMQKFQVDENGSCTSCKSNGRDLPKSELIKCSYCKEHFHAICDAYEASKAICNKSFFRLFTQGSTKNNFTWTCDACVTNIEIAKHATLEQQVQSLMGIVTTLSKEVKELKSLAVPIFKKTSSGTGNTEEVLKTTTIQEADGVNPKTWSQVARHTPEKASLLIKGDNGKAIDLDIVKDIVVTNKIPVTSTAVKDNGDTYLNFPCQHSRAKATPMIKSKMADVKEIVTLKSKLPTISISGITEKLSKVDLTERICNQNEEINACVKNGSCLEVIFIKEPTVHFNTYLAVVRVSCDVREAIKARGNRIFIGLVACSVKDRFYVKRCNNCQCFGHYQGDCNKPVMCGYCGEQHKSSGCTKKMENNEHATHRCNNCKLIGKDSTGHSTFYHRCPAYLVQQNKLKKSIDYYNGTKPLN